MSRRLFLKLMLSAPVLLGAPLAMAEGLRPRQKPGTAQTPLLMLDPGHGGRDPGAIGVSGTYEKDVVLDLALRVAERLGDLSPTRIRLTRENDRFLALPERVAIAREAAANLFVSLHADSAPDSGARGLSAYTLSETATDDFAAKLAASENIVDQRYGATFRENKADVANILFDLTARQTKAASKVAKEAIVRGAGTSLRLLDNPKRSANFAVLRAPDMPSLLIESGFLSNSDDEQLLSTPASRRKIADVLARELANVMKDPLFS